MSRLSQGVLWTTCLSPYLHKGKGYVTVEDMSRNVKEERNEAILKLAQEGISLRDIAAQFNVSFQRVHQIVKAAQLNTLKENS